MNAQRSFLVNARFVTRRTTGVDRVAIELVMALAARDDVAALILAHPPAAQLHVEWLAALPEAVRSKIQVRAIGNTRGHLWEQTVLALYRRDLTLLSLCSTGPVLRRNHAVMIHDAQVWDAPDSFSWKFRLAYRALLPILGRSARHVLTVSRFAATRLQAVGISPAGKVRVVLNGADHITRIAADPETLARYGLQRGGYFLAIGSLAPHKNLRLLTDAAARRDMGPELIVAGGQNSKVFADAGLVAQRGVRFIGRVTDAELKALYSGALALAFPSMTEGFGLPPVEAMLCDCPVIATTGGAVPEVCGDAVLYADPTDPTAWTTRLTALAADAPLRAALATRGAAQARRYTWTDAAESLMRALSL